ncbi:cutinase 1-like [Haliotis asinina]|uniref:cutinase 1-like n=1 Tax=Haliotis asinina TaxID=109174 RepID=UPI003531928F
MRWTNILCLFYSGYIIHEGACSGYQDKGNPYHDGPLETQEQTIETSQENSPLHAKVFAPAVKGDYSAVFFVGGLNGYVPVEAYQIVQQKIASHGFVVIGVDYKYPILRNSSLEENEKLDQDLNKFFDELTWLKSHLSNLTQVNILWNQTSLMCHSSGCDVTIRMIRMNSTLFRGTVFLEPMSLDVKPVNVTLPALMYGTQLSEEGALKCCIPGFDYKKFFDIWQCPKIKMEVADFGHCDILDHLPWEGCHTIHFCKTTNDTRLVEYRQFVQGVVSAFNIGYTQGWTPALTYIENRTNVPLKLLDFDVQL